MKLFACLILFAGCAGSAPDRKPATSLLRFRGGLAPIIPGLPDDLPETWRRTLYDGDTTIDPVVVLNGLFVP